MTMCRFQKIIDFAPVPQVAANAYEKSRGLLILDILFRLRLNYGKKQAWIFTRSWNFTNQVEIEASGSVFMKICNMKSFLVILVIKMFTVSMEMSTFVDNNNFRSLPEKTVRFAAIVSSKNATTKWEFY